MQLLKKALFLLILLPLAGETDQLEQDFVATIQLADKCTVHPSTQSAFTQADKELNTLLFIPFMLTRIPAMLTHPR